MGHISGADYDPQRTGEYLEKLGKAIQDGKASVQDISEERGISGVDEELEIELKISFIPREGLVLQTAVKYDDGLPREDIDE